MNKKYVTYSFFPNFTCLCVTKTIITLTCVLANQQESRGSEGRILAVILEANDLSSKGKGKPIFNLKD